MKTPALDQMAVVIPVWQPEERLVRLAEGLTAAGFGAVVVVDDGSDVRCAGVFGELRQLGVQVLHHMRNRGKGRALKTGMRHVLDELPEMLGVVTADADGQHTAADVVRVAEAVLGAGGRMVLGARSFAGDVPWRSRLGNGMTQRLFGWVTGVWLADTQTGLRGFPRRMLVEAAMLQGERYEYEMTVLADVCGRGERPVEVAIETVYLEGNRSSHFDPLWDSVRIYGVLAGIAFSRGMGRGGVLRRVPSEMR